MSWLVPWCRWPELNSENNCKSRFDLHGLCLFPGVFWPENFCFCGFSHPKDRDLSVPVHWECKCTKTWVLQMICVVVAGILIASPYKCNHTRSGVFLKVLNVMKSPSSGSEWSHASFWQNTAPNVCSDPKNNHRGNDCKGPPPVVPSAQLLLLAQMDTWVPWAWKPPSPGKPVFFSGWLDFMCFWENEPLKTIVVLAHGASRGKNCLKRAQNNPSTLMIRTLLKFNVRLWKVNDSL